MKAFLQHDESGLLYQESGAWVRDPHQALAFPSTSAAEQFRQTQEINPAHAVLRIDPSLLTFAGRAPGAYQVGE